MTGQSWPFSSSRTVLCPALSACGECRVEGRTSPAKTNVSFAPVTIESQNTNQRIGNHRSAFPYVRYQTQGNKLSQRQIINSRFRGNATRIDERLIRFHFTEASSGRVLPIVSGGSSFPRQAAKKPLTLERRFVSPEQRRQLSIRYVLCTVPNIIKQLPQKHCLAASNHTRISISFG